LASETITATGGLQITVDRGEDGTLVRLSGRLSIDSSPALRERLLALLQAEPPETVIVDLRETPYIDLSGIATLIEALKIARDRSTTLRLQGLHDYLLHFLEVTGLLPLFEGAGGASTQSVSKVI
jgi:anti-anti-sigma factor